MKKIPSLMKKIRHHIYFNQLNNKLVLAVSGGIDSMVMLDIFLKYRQHNCDISVFHVNHNTGAFANEAERLVTNVAIKHKLPIQKEYFTHREGNFEKEASKFRHEKAYHENTLTLWAHHKQDQSETVIQSLIRGVGIATPLGMRFINGMDCRPLLDIDKDEIIEYAKKYDIEYIDDPSNEDTSYCRNAIRHKVLPELRNFYYNLDKQLSGFAEDLSELHDELDKRAIFLVHHAFHDNSLNLSCFSTREKYLWDFILRRFYMKCGIKNPNRINGKLIKEWILTDKESYIQMSSGKLWVGKGYLHFKGD